MPELWDDAECHFADALVMNERLGARPYVVRTRLRRHATRPWRPGDVTRAAEVIDHGLAEARTLGMAREVTRLERLRERL